MEEKQGEVYAGSASDDAIEITVESAPAPKTGDHEGEIIVETVETTEKRSWRNATPTMRPSQKSPKGKKKAGILAAVIVVLLLFGCMGAGGNNNSDSNTSSDTTTASEPATEEIIEEETEEEPEVEDEAPVDEYDSWTSEQQHAYNSGLSYLDYTAFSKQGLIDQLSSEYGEGYPKDVAEFAVNKIEERGEVDWVEQAKRAAESYLDYSDFSKQGLIDQLSSEYGEQFTVEQATEAVEAVY